MTLEDEGSSAPPPGERSPTDDLRLVNDARTMRALTHPVRIALIEQLSVFGPLTATQAGEQIGESATTCSFHLRQLAKYGFVEEAGGGKGRARPWKMRSIGMTLSTHGGDPETAVAGQALARIVRERSLDRMRQWNATQGAYPEQWQNASADSEFVFHVTAEEMQGLKEEVYALLVARYRERLTDPSLRPEGSLPVEALFFCYPVDAPSGK